MLALIQVLSYVFLILIKTSCGVVFRLHYTCEDVYHHSNWHLLDNQDFCGTYDLSEPYTDEYYAEDPETDELRPPGDEGNSTITARILRGITTRKNEHPWIAQVLFRVSLSTAPFCGGTLISKRYVLTAGHCLIYSTSDNSTDVKKPAARLLVRLGTNKRDNQCNPDGTCTGFLQYGVEETFIPNTLSKKNIGNFPVYEDDIGLLRLDTDSVLTKGVVSSMCLPKCSMLNQLLYGNKMVMAGFGAKYEEPFWEYQGELQKYYSTVKATANCSSQFFKREKMICTASLSQTCGGDSGGPLMLLTKEMKNGTLTSIYYEIGVMSRSAACIKSSPLYVSDAVYTRIAYYMPWILESIRD